MNALTYIEHGKFALTEQGKVDTTPLITHRFRLQDIEKTYRIFEGKLDGVIKIAATP